MTKGEARRIWNRFGLAYPIGTPNYLFENAEALLKLEEKHAQELASARRAAFDDAAKAVCRYCVDGVAAELHPQSGYWHTVDERRNEYCMGSPIRELAAKEGKQ